MAMYLDKISIVTRRFLNKYICLVQIVIFVQFIFPNNAYAYLDPGSGSYFYQIILSILFGGLLFFKQFWKRIISFLSLKKNNKKG